MVSDKIVEFQEGNIGYLMATRSADLQPKIGKPFAISISADRKSITLFGPEADLKKHIPDLIENGELALTAGAIPSHETYQYKGRYVEHHPCSENEMEHIYQGLERYGTGVREFGFPQQLIDEVFPTLTVAPAMAITFEVKEIFEQTPKPGTGEKIN